MRVNFDRQNCQGALAAFFVMRGHDVLIIQTKEDSGQAGLWTLPAYAMLDGAEDPFERLKTDLGMQSVYPTLRDTIALPHGAHDPITVNVYQVPLYETRALTLSERTFRWCSVYDLAAEVSRRPNYFAPWVRTCFEGHAERVLKTVIPV